MILQRDTTIMQEKEQAERCGKKIKTLDMLVWVAQQRLSVIVPGYRAWGKPKPASFILQMPAMTVWRLIESGMYTYKQCSKKEKKYWWQG